MTEAALHLPPSAPDRGLDDAAVAERMARDAVNAASRRHSRTYAGILRANLLTRVNALLGLLWVAALIVVADPGSSPIPRLFWKTPPNE